MSATRSCIPLPASASSSRACLLHKVTLMDHFSSRFTHSAIDGDQLEHANHFPVTLTDHHPSPGGPPSPTEGQRQVTATLRRLPNAPAIAFQYTQRRSGVKSHGVVDASMTQNQQGPHSSQQSPLLFKDFPSRYVSLGF
ncbi:hypothetical protein ECG_09906 [Echinococcus granulosus]|nr:hypothetical protein ECG_09906 [Echinococcus granulosus]